MAETPLHSPLAPPPPPAPGQIRQWSGLADAAAALAVGRLALSRPSGVTLIIAANGAAAQRWQRELGFFTPTLQVLPFPDRETLPYDAFSPHEDIVSERIATLNVLRNRSPGSPSIALVVPVQTLCERICPVTYLDAHALQLETGQRFDLHAFRRRLEGAGYQANDTVAHRGEFAVRGSLLDIFPMGAAAPIRVDLFDDEIESLRTFDPDTQRTLERISDVRLLPAR